MSRKPSEKVNAAEKNGDECRFRDSLVDLAHRFRAKPSNRPEPIHADSARRRRGSWQKLCPQRARTRGSGANRSKCCAYVPMGLRAADEVRMFPMFAVTAANCSKGVGRTRGRRERYAVGRCIRQFKAQAA